MVPAVVASVPGFPVVPVVSAGFSGAVVSVLVAFCSALAFAALAKIEQMNAERDAAEADANLVAEAGVCPECLRLAKDAE